MSNKTGFKMADNYQNAMGNYIKVKASKITYDPELMHIPTANAVAGMVSLFDARLVDPFKVVEAENGSYRLIDGVCSFMALREIMQKKGRKDFEVMCRVFTGLEREDIARMYATHTDLRRRLPMGYKIRALEVAKDPEILDFIKVTRSSGLSVKPGDAERRNGHISAICTALKAYRKLGKTEYLRMLKLIHKTWAGESWSLTMNMLGGMAGFMSSHDFNCNTFVRKMRYVTYSEICDKAREFRGMSKEGAFTAAIADLFAEQVDSKAIPEAV